MAALALGMFAASAIGKGGNHEEPYKTTPTETTPTVTTPTPTTPTVTTPPVTPAPPVEEVQPPALVNVAPVVAPAVAPAPAAAVAPAPAALPQEEVRGEADTRDEGGSGSNGGPTVVAQADDTGTEATGSPSGELAQTGLNMSLLALVGGLALAGSAVLFRRSRLD